MVHGLLGLLARAGRADAMGALPTWARCRRGRAAAMGAASHAGGSALLCCAALRVAAAAGGGRPAAGHCGGRGGRRRGHGRIRAAKCNGRLRAPARRARPRWGRADALLAPCGQAGGRQGPAGVRCVSWCRAEGRACSAWQLGFCMCMPCCALQSLRAGVVDMGSRLGVRGLPRGPRPVGRWGFLTQGLEMGKGGVGLL